MLKWTRNRLLRKREEFYKGHDLYLSQLEPNKAIQRTCRKCGLLVQDLWEFSPYPPRKPLPTRCPVD